MFFEIQKFQHSRPYQPKKKAQTKAACSSALAHPAAALYSGMQRFSQFLSQSGLNRCAVHLIQKLGLRAHPLFFQNASGRKTNPIFTFQIYDSFGEYGGI